MSAPESTYRPVQGPDSQVPGTRAGTGHVVGETYACHYGGDTYRADIAHADGSVTVHSLAGDAFSRRPRRHRTRLHMDGRRNRIQDDHPVWEECRNRWECRERSDAWRAAVASLLAGGFANVV